MLGSRLTADPIHGFLLSCLCSRWQSEALEIARGLARNPDFPWAALHEAAVRELLVPLVCRALPQGDLLPLEFDDVWQALYAGCLQRNLHLLRELDTVLDALGAARVEVILLKGAALLRMVYDDPALRPMADLDLLVRREDMAAAVRALATAGYVAAKPEARPGLALDFENELLLHKPGPLPIPLDLHWSLFDSPHHQRRVSMDWFWQTARSPRLEGEGAGGEVLGPEAQLLHLCAHLALHHRGQGLLWLHDIAEVLHFDQDRLDWGLLLAKAAEYDLVLPLQLVLPRVVEDWAAPVPAAILELLRQLQPSAAEVEVFNRLTAERRPVAQRFYSDLASIPDWRQRLRYGVGSLLPTPAYMRQRYVIRHSLLLPLLYPYRWLLGVISALRLVQLRRQPARRLAHAWLEPDGVALSPTGSADPAFAPLLRRGKRLLPS